MTLLEHYNEILNQPDKWRYYKDMPIPGPLAFTEEYCRNFINNYLETGLKCPLPKKMPPLRILHTVSVYFLGLTLFYYVFGGNRYTEPQRSVFLYYWFLTCLYHDIGYIYENDIITRHHGISAVRKKLNEILPSLPASLIIVKDPQLVENYFLFREEKDHGISGAVKMFQDLRSSHLNLKSKLRAAYPNEDVLSLRFPGTNIHLNEKRFPLAAATIAVHNIWMGNDNNAKKYQKYGLEALINQKYDFCDDALLFWVLQIADTIEPIKRITNNSPSNVEWLLKSINLECERDTLLITYEKPCPVFDYQRWIISCCDLSSWTNISARTEADGFISLTIPHSF